MNKNINFRTDMADERVDEYKKINNLTKLNGVEVISNNIENVEVVRVNVLNEDGKEALKKDIGTYITIETNDIKYMDDEEENKLINVVANELKELLKNKSVKEKSSILVVGLGNEYITPDALGPKVVKNVSVTRHILNYAKELLEENTKEVSAITPGVLGTTGIETSDIIKSIVQNIKPDAVIAIDSLASSSMHRIGNTIQLSDTGITPGAGVKNKREGLNLETLGIPVIGVGVPTVVDISTITNEAIDKMLENTKNSMSDLENINENDLNYFINFFSQEERYNMIANLLNSNNYILTPKEVDELIDLTSSIIGKSLNLALDIKL